MPSIPRDDAFVADELIDLGEVVLSLSSKLDAMVSELRFINARLAALERTSATVERREWKEQ